ncbi:hypothetical protein FOCC_FOCC013692 [Frankliniella occidentalis]|nr:hypothetical protein FOCC_FOCC013692 [Frankliniella occidentalis]
MDGHAMQSHDIVKKEPAEVTYEMDTTLEDSFITKTDLSEMHLSSTIEEMDLIHLKTEADLDEKACIVDKQENILLLQSPALKNPKAKSRNHIHPVKLMKIAKDYVDLYSDDLSHPSPFRKVLRFPIIQCPSCLIPTNARGRSAFLHLLLHVTERHPNKRSNLFSEICERYRLLIARMKETVASQRKTGYCLRYRITEPQGNSSWD